MTTTPANSYYFLTLTCEAYGKDKPDFLPARWSNLTVDLRREYLAIVHNFSLIEKNQLARHIIGCEIVDSKTKISAERAEAIWELVFRPTNVYTAPLMEANPDLSQLLS
jgi:hypothetical protein